MLPDDHLHHVKLYSAIYRHIFAFSDSNGLDIQSLVLYLGVHTIQSTQNMTVNMECLSPFNDIREIEILNVVAGNNVRIKVLDEFDPSFDQI